MAMESPAFWLVLSIMLVGKSGCANDASMSSGLTAGQHGPGRGRTASLTATRPDEFLKFS